MSQTQLTTQPIDIANETFGELVKLPNILTENKGRAERAVSACRSAIDTVKEMDFTKVDATNFETVHIKKINELRAKAKLTLETMNDARKPFTQFFDNIKGQFTAEEAKVKEVLEELKQQDDNWQREKGRRQKEEDAKIAAELAKKEERITYRAAIFTTITDSFSHDRLNTINKMWDKFNEQSLESIDNYVEKLKVWTPTLTDNQFAQYAMNGNLTAKHLSGDEVAEIYEAVKAELKPQISAKYTETITAERDRAILELESRKAELNRIINDAQAAQEAQERMAKEKAEREQAARDEQKAKEQEVLMNAEAEKTNAIFDAHADAIPVVGISKGTQVKKKYKVTAAGGYIAIIQSWVKNELPTLTADELEKKLSFMVTAANKRLNAGETLEAKGLEVEEDYSTRVRKSA